MADGLIYRPGLRHRVLLGAVVLGVHLLIVDRLADSIAAWSADAEMAPRLQVVYVREMVLAEPPDLAPVPVAVAARSDRPEAARRPPREPSKQTTQATAGGSSTSTPTPPATAETPGDNDEAAVESNTIVDPQPAPSPIQPDAPVIDPADETIELAQSGLEPRQAEVGSEASADARQPFVWPASTRLSYVLTGNYRGEVHGSAQVEWINAAPRYQVNLDVTVGLPFAPLFTRQMRSDGQLTAAGLQPQHYSEQSKLAFNDRRQIGFSIASDGLTTDGGRRLPVSPLSTAEIGAESSYGSAIQDSASQFVQLTYLFTTRPQLLQPGTRIVFALALPSGLRRWVYEVGQLQPVYTHFGAIDAFHVRPAPGTERGRDLLAQAWFAPQLAYLPVRIRIEQQAEVFLDLVIKSRPELAAR